MLAHPELKHGPIRIIFTCDEEVGHGTDKLDLKKIGLQVAYTLDGEAAARSKMKLVGQLAVVTITGKNIHPASPRGGWSTRSGLAAAFIERMPWQLARRRRRAALVSCIRTSLRAACRR